MSNAERLPVARKVLDRYIAGTGATMLEPHRFGWNAIVEFGMPPTKLEHAMVVVADRHGERQAMAPIGFYDPVTDAWRFPPEYVRPEERKSLAAAIGGTLLPYVRGQLMPIAIADGEKVIDPHDPFTRKVRTQVAGVLASLNPISWLQRDGVKEQLLGNGREKGAFLGADGFTTTTASVSTAHFTETTVRPVGANDTLSRSRDLAVAGGQLTLHYKGVLAESDAPGHTVRSSRGLVLAVRDPRLPDTWAPNLSVVTPAEWEAVGELPGIINQAAAENPNFVPSHCSVVYNYRPE